MMQHKYSLNKYNVNLVLYTNKKLVSSTIKNILSLYAMYTKDLDNSNLLSSMHKFNVAQLGLPVRYSIIFFNYVLWFVQNIKQIKNNDLILRLINIKDIDSWIILYPNLYIAKLQNANINFSHFIQSFTLYSLVSFLHENKGLYFYISTSNFVYTNFDNVNQLMFSDGLQITYSEKISSKTFYYKVLLPNVYVEDKKFVFFDRSYQKQYLDNEDKKIDGMHIFMSPNIFQLKLLDILKFYYDFGNENIHFDFLIKFINDLNLDIQYTT
ncbi:MAG: hypothetical protein NZZ41_05765 [Candidatus Dojkabacteria bacterium]|nr:hypothetical protein [Candidatus Dojkabacteria bacterium]